MIELPVRAEFDYSPYGDELADELRQTAERIRSRGQDQIAAILDIGHDLSKVKEKVGHGNWGAWLKSEFAMSTATAERYMRGADFIAEKRAQGKFVTMTNLKPGLLYSLSAKSAPPALVQEALDRVEGNAPMSEKEFKSRFAAIKDTNPAAGITSGDGTPPEPKNPTSESERQREAANAAVVMLRKSLGDNFPHFVKLWEEAGVAFGVALRSSAAIPGLASAPMPEVDPAPPSVATDGQDGDGSAGAQPAAAELDSAEPPVEPGEPPQQTVAEPSPPELTPLQDPVGTTTPVNDNAEELETPSAELPGVEPGAPAEDVHPPTMAARLAMRQGATFAPPGIGCRHPKGSCGYAGCQAAGRCLVPSSPGAAA